jgi:hypothetical protein
MAEEEAVQPVGVRAGSEVHGAASLLQGQRPDRDDDGVYGSVSGSKRWRLALDR